MRRTLTVSSAVLVAAAASTAACSGSPGESVGESAAALGGTYGLSMQHLRRAELHRAA